MAQRIVRRLAGTLLVLVVVSFLTFAGLAAVPGDAAQAMVGDVASTEQIDALRQQMGLDQPLLVRYFDFTRSLLRGDLGRSLVSDRPVATLLGERMPYTLILAIAAVAIALVGGALLGIAAALRAGGIVDAVIMGAASLGLAVPVFWSALLLMLVFSLRLHWLPVVGAASPRHLVLPAVTLALPTLAMVARIVRSSLLDVMGADYIRTARAKGLGERAILRRHIAHNALIPILAVVGVQFGHLLGGSFITETIFGWPGLGRLTVQAIFDRDTPVVLGAALVIAAIYIVANLVVDVAQGWLDPRVAHEAL